jgi:hypothetical protein
VLVVHSDRICLAYHTHSLAGRTQRLQRTPLVPGAALISWS